MKVLEAFVRRPVLSIVINLFILMVGFICFYDLPIRSYPKYEKPQLFVMIDYPGASPEIIEQQITTPIERGLGDLPGLDIITSNSQAERGRINLKFLPHIKLKEIASEISYRLNKITPHLPKDAGTPILHEGNNEDSGFMALALTNTDISPTELTEFAERFVKNNLLNIEGIAKKLIIGVTDIMAVRLDSTKLMKLHLTINDVKRAILSTYHLPSGILKEENQEIAFAVPPTLSNAEQFNQLIISHEKNHIIRLIDIGTAELIDDPKAWQPRLNGNNITIIQLFNHIDANPIAISDKIRVELPNIQKKLPEGFKLEIARDDTVYLKNSLKNVYLSILEACILVMFIIFLFLRSWRAALIPIITIPLSLIGSFIFLYFFGYSLNILTLLALVLAIGLVVDDAIVMLENISRHLDKGLTPLQASIKGCQEIAIPIILMTITLIIVYLPLAFTHGLTGQLFQEFAISLTGAILISGIISLILSPMMCSKLLKKNNEPKFKQYKFIDILLTKKYLALGTFLFVIAGIFLLWNLLPKELTPKEDSGSFIISLYAPGGSKELILPYLNQAEKLVAQIPEIETYLSYSYNNGANVHGTLKPWNERSRHIDDILEPLRKPLNKMVGVWASASVIPSPLQKQKKGLKFYIQTTDSYEDLYYQFIKLRKKLVKELGTPNIGLNFNLNSPLIQLEPDHEKIAMFNIKLDDIQTAAQTYFTGNRSLRFKQDQIEKTILIEVDPNEDKTIEELTNVYVKGNKENKEFYLPLSDFLKPQYSQHSHNLFHFNQLRAGFMTITPPDDMHMSEVVAKFHKIADQILPSNYIVNYGGDIRKHKQSMQEIAFIFGLAMIAIFLILAALYESFVDPLIILMTVPLSIFGALFVLWITGNTLNIFSQIGLVTLIGLITKHGILIVDFANRAVKAGASFESAAREAIHLRLRPIVMTTLTTLLGAVPLIIGHDAGAAIRAQIGWTLIGGLISGTFLSLFILPHCYIYMKRFKLALQKSL
jgi:multidrug efflux pump